MGVNAPPMGNPGSTTDFFSLDLNLLQKFLQGVGWGGSKWSGVGHAWVGGMWWVLVGWVMVG